VPEGIKVEGWAFLTNTHWDREVPRIHQGHNNNLNSNNNSNNYNNASPLGSEEFLSQIRAVDRLRIILEQTFLCLIDPEEEMIVIII